MCSNCADYENPYDGDRMADRTCICGHKESEHFLARIPGGEMKNICWHDESPDDIKVRGICPCLEFKDALEIKPLTVGKN